MCLATFAFRKDCCMAPRKSALLSGRVVATYTQSVEGQEHLAQTQNIL